MIDRFAPKTARTVLRGVRAVLLVFSISSLSYCAYVLADSWLFELWAVGEIERPTLDLPADSQFGDVFPAVRVASTSETTSGLIGRIEIPRLELSAVVLEGTSRATLRRGVGHITGTALPGEAGNVGLSAHRDRHFRPLRLIKVDDEIVLTTKNGQFRYRVVSMTVVKPSETGVLRPVGRDVLTLVTCYPFFVAGPAPNRFIVQAEKVEVQ